MAGIKPSTGSGRRRAALGGKRAVRTPAAQAFQASRARANIQGIRRQIGEQKSIALRHRDALRTAHRSQRGFGGMESYEIEAEPTKHYKKMDLPESETKHARKAIQVHRITEKAARKGVSISPSQVAGRLGKLARKGAGKLPMVSLPSQYSEFKSGMQRFEDARKRKKAGVLSPRFVNDKTVGGQI